MDYKRIYEQLTAKDMKSDYTEIHHIIPRCMGGTNDPSNLVRLTPEAHYVAHQLLVKIYPNNNSLAHAAHMMTVGNKRNNKLYGWLRHRYSIAARINATGKTHSEETRAKMSAAASRNRSEEHRAKIGEANKNRIWSDETRAKIGAASRNKSEETRAKMSAANKGKTPTAETRAKMSAARKGKTPTAETRAKMSAAIKNRPLLTCPHCNKASNNNMKRYHFDNCKQKVK